MTGPVVLIDGECVLCSRVARFVIRHDSRAVVRFAALDSPAGRAELKSVGIEAPPAGTFVLLQGGIAYYRSSAAWRLALLLDSPWNALSLVRFFPRPIRDAVYSLVARCRHRLMGRTTGCQIFTDRERARFLSGGLGFSEVPPKTGENNARPFQGPPGR